MKNKSGRAEAKPDTLYLIDGSAYIYRAYHAIRNLSNSEGLPTNAIFGFTRMINNLIEEKAPVYAAMVFDAKGPTFRHKMYSEYKANRPPMPEDLAVQIPYIKKVTDGFNIRSVEKAGFEADDLIGTLAGLAEAAGFDVVMVTGDKDFVQLVTDKITIWDPMKEKSIDAESVMDTFGVMPRQMIEVMGLSGDSADNIPGVPGIGQKTALSIIRSFTSIEKLYEQIHRITKKKQKENLINFQKQAILSRDLVTIETHVPLSFEPDQFRLQNPDPKILAPLFKELEFRQFQKLFPKTSDLSGKAYRAIQDKEALKDLIAQLSNARLFAVDTETTSTNPMMAKLVGISFSLIPHEAVYIPLAHAGADCDSQLNLKETLEQLRPVLENPKIKKIGQNIKYDWMVLKQHGVELEGVYFDTMLASYLLNPSKRAHNLDQIALDFLDYHKISYQEVAGTGKKAICFSKVPIQKAFSYACEDADITLMAYHVLKEKLHEKGLSSLLETLEMPLIPVLKRMEMCGICVDKPRLEDLSKSFKQDLEVLEVQIYAAAGESFNIKSSQQLGRIMFEKLGLPVQKKTRKRTAYSTDVDVLTRLAPLHELPALILRYRTLAKLKSTYTDALLELIHPQTGRIHTSYNQTVTATGRLSSSDPNLQNIPIRTDEGKQIRGAFIPRKGWYLLAADYSQIELRILAHYSGDLILTQAFMADEDIHMRTATEVFQVFPAMITPDLRRQAKVINFGIIYGMSAYGLSKELGISRKMAQTYITHYFSRYKGVHEYIEKTIAEAEKNKQIGTLLGRIRQLPDMDSPNRNIRQLAQRTAINTPIQGTAADLIKAAMIKVDAGIRKEKLQTAMLLSVHDELVFEVPPEELQQVTHLVKAAMEGIWKLNVPLKVNIAYGANWTEAH